MGHPPEPQLPVDSDVDLRVPKDRAELRRAPWAVLGVISLGGGIGGVARYAIGAALPSPADGFPWATFLVNVTGCLLIGVLMVLVSEIWSRRRLMRPFLGVGVLGGYTTFSVSMMESQRLLEVSAAGTAALYLTGTAVTALLAVTAGITATKRILRRRDPTGQAPPPESDSGRG